MFYDMLLILNKKVLPLINTYYGRLLNDNRGYFSNKGFTNCSYNFRNSPALSIRKQVLTEINNVRFRLFF